MLLNPNRIYQKHLTIIVYIISTIIIVINIVIIVIDINIPIVVVIVIVSVITFSLLLPNSYRYYNHY